MNTCEHDSASGTGVPREWRCDGCGYLYREVDDPDGSVYSWALGVSSPRMIRYEGVSE